MNNMIEIRDLKKHDLFFYNNIVFVTHEVDKCFRAVGITPEGLKIEISGISNRHSNFKVELIA